MHKLEKATPPKNFIIGKSNSLPAILCLCWIGGENCERADARWFAATLMAAANDNGGGKNDPAPVTII